MRKAAGSFTSMIVVAVLVFACEGRPFPPFGINTTDSTGTGGGVASATVRIIDNAYQPTLVNLQNGGFVTWVWDTSATTHNVTFDNPALVAQSSPTQSRGTHTVVFTSVGTASYHCTIHPEMTGSIVVH